MNSGNAPDGEGKDRVLNNRGPHQEAEEAQDPPQATVVHLSRHPRADGSREKQYEWSGSRR